MRPSSLTQIKTLERPWTDEEISALRARNQKRTTQLKAQLGKKFLLHPDNRVARVPGKAHQASQSDSMISKHN